jgi:hypothetical protein
MDIIPENRKKEAWLETCLKVYQQLLDRGLTPETASRCQVGGLLGGRKGGLVGGRVLAGGIPSHLLHLDRELSLLLLDKYIYEGGREMQSLFNFALCNNFNYCTWRSYIPNELKPHKAIPDTELSSLQSVEMGKFFFASGGWGKYSSLEDFLKSSEEYSKINVTHWRTKFACSDDEEKGVYWPGKETQEAFRTRRAVELYNIYKNSSSSDGTHFTPKSLESFLHKENMNDTGLKIKSLKFWKQSFDIAKEKRLTQSDFNIRTRNSMKRKSSS